MSLPLTLNLHVGGLDNALAISGMFTITVLIPFPFPSTWNKFGKFIKLNALTDASASTIYKLTNMQL